MSKHFPKAVASKQIVPPVPSPPIKPVSPGQIVYVSVLPKVDIIGNGFDASPRVFATREAAQADCDKLNAGRMAGSQFVVREMAVN